MSKANASDDFFGRVVSHSSIMFLTTFCCCLSLNREEGCKCIAQQPAWNLSLKITGFNDYKADLSIEPVVAFIIISF